MAGFNRLMRWSRLVHSVVWSSLTLGCVGGWAHPSAVAAHEGQHVDSTEAAGQDSPLGASRARRERVGDRWLITGDGLPGHARAAFPNRSNPNAIREQSVRFMVPATPTAAADFTPLQFPGKFGVAINGVAFDPQAAEWWQRNPRSGWSYEPLAPGTRFLGLDESHAHVQPDGTYHYHGIPTALVEQIAAEQALEALAAPAGTAPERAVDDLVLVGWAADGFPLYAASPGSPSPKSSYRVKTGSRPGGPGGSYDGTFTEDWEYVPGLGDLDQANGRTAATPEHPDGTYHYVLTDTFPFVPRFFRGQPDESFRGGRGPRGEPGGRAGPRPSFRPPPRR